MNLLRKLNRLEELILVAMFIAMVIIIFVQVIMRYVFSNSLYWSEELGKFLFVWISWLGISVGEMRFEHIKITILSDRLGLKGKHIANIISELIVIAICSVTIYYSVIMVITQHMTHYTGIKISVAWGYMAVIIGCGLMIIKAAANGIASIGGIKTNTPIENILGVSQGGEEI